MGFLTNTFSRQKSKLKNDKNKKKTLLHKIHICIRLSLAKEINLNRIDE